MVKKMSLERPRHASSEDDDDLDANCILPPASAAFKLGKGSSLARREQLRRTWKLFRSNALFLLLGIALFFVGEFLPHYAVLDRFLMAAGTVCAAYSIINTYAAAGREAFPKDWQWFQPLRGGLAFISLQIAAWTTFFFFISVPIIPFVAALYFPSLVFNTCRLAAAVLALLAQVVMVTSLFTYHKSDAKEPHLFGVHTALNFLQSQSGHDWWGTFIGLQVLLALVGLGVASLAETYNPQDAVLLLFTALSCFAFALFLTYGVGGRWKYHQQQWRFYQPFLGGFMFVVLQMLAWTFFTTAGFVFIAHAEKMLKPDDNQLVFLQMLHKDHLPSIWSAALAAFLAEILNVTSLLVYQPENEDNQKKGQKRENIFQVAARVALVVIVMNLEKVIIAFFFLSLFLNRFIPTTVVTTWILLGSGYIWSYRNHPSVTGWRMKRSLVDSWTVRCFEKYFSFQLYKHGKTEFNSSARYVFGFAPHGIVPVTAAYLTRTAQWQALVGDFLPAILTSSIIHYVPLIRDCLQYLGAVEVSRQGFRQGLERQKSVLLVPGGQVEMLDSNSSSHTIAIDTSHKGFIKVALEAAVDAPEKPHFIVPVYSFGETQVLDNISAPKSLQKTAISMFGANVIFMPYGAFGLVGVARPVPVSAVIGEPVYVPALKRHTREHVDLLHRRYMTSLNNAFKDTRGKVEGHQDDVIDFRPPIALVKDSEFHEEWNKIPVGDLPKPARRVKSGTLEFAWMGMLLSVLFWTVVYTAHFAE